MSDKSQNFNENMQQFQSFLNSFGLNIKFVLPDEQYIHHDEQQSDAAPAETKQCIITHFPRAEHIQ